MDDASNGRLLQNAVSVDLVNNGARYKCSVEKCLVILFCVWSCMVAYLMEYACVGVYLYACVWVCVCLVYRYEYGGGNMYTHYRHAAIAAVVLNLSNGL